MNALELSGFGVSFGSRVVLANLNLTLPARGIDVLMGPVGTGKSTLLRTLTGLHSVNPRFRSWGSVNVAGQPLAASNRPLLVHQRAASIGGSVRDALLFHARGAQTRSGAAWDSTLSQVCVEHELAGRLKDGLEGSTIALSTLLQRQVNILSFVLAAPPLLMLDEPTTGLEDSDAQEMVLWLSRLGLRCKMLVVLHNQKQAKLLAARITLLGGGRVLANTSCADFFSNPPNTHAVQFVRTGSLAIPAPDARREELDDGAAPPPELPHSAREAVQQFESMWMPDYQGPSGFHWIIPRQLAGCAEPGLVMPIHYDLELLVNLGVTHLVTLTESDLNQQALANAGLKNIYLPVPDMHAPSIAQARMLVRRVQQLMDSGQVVAVHCRAGIGRTGTVLACWLIGEKRLSAAAAMAQLREVSPNYVQTLIQERFLSHFEQACAI